MSSPKRGPLGGLFGSGQLSLSLANNPTMQLPWIGFRIFKWLLFAIGVIVTLIAVFAWQTYPSQADVLAVLGADAAGPEKLAAVNDARDAWLGQVKDLAQLFVFASFFPAMTAVTGYIFGVSRQKSDPDPDPGADPNQQP